LKRGRDDDTEVLITERLRNYHNEIDPILNYYEQKDLLTSIDGLGTIEQIQESLRKL
jgi:adenylate kinase